MTSILLAVTRVSMLKVILAVGSAMQLPLLMVRRASKLLGSAEASNDLAVFGRIQWSGDDLTLGVELTS